MAGTWSKLGIWNRALDELKETPLATETDDNANQRWLSRNYDKMRDNLIAGHAWNFALQRVLIPADATPPAFGWLYRYELPADCLRLLPLRYQGEFNGCPVVYEVENGFVLTDTGAPLYVRYIRRVVLEGQYSAPFGEALALYMATAMAYKLTGKTSWKETIANEANRALRDAKRHDVLTGGTTERTNANDVIAVR